MAMGQLPWYAFNWQAQETFDDGCCHFFVLSSSFRQCSKVTSAVNCHVKSLRNLQLEIN